MYQKTTLPNGLRIVSATMPHTRSVSLSFFIGAGSRYENDAEAGLSHYVEHLCFKGTERRPSPRAVSEPIEAVGGMLNGGTDRELTVYWSKVARPHFRLALDVLTDLIRYPLFDEAEVEKERRVIVEELNMMADSPQQRVDALIDEVIWPNQPLGREVAGTKETVASFSRAQLRGYLERQYVPNNVVVSLAGDVSHDEVVAALEESLGSWRPGSPKPPFPADDGQEAPRLALERRRSEQAHLCLGLRGLSYHHPDRYALDLLNVVLGEGMSSRLFQEVRERQGLAYDIHSYVSHFIDSGAVIIYAGVDPKRIESTTGAILHELARLKEAVPAEELSKAKEFAKGRLMLAMEDSRAVCGWLGRQEMLLGRIRTVDEVIALVDGLEPEDLERVAQGLFVTERLSLAVVGPLQAKRRLQGLLRL